jgi:3-deoxy-D-manno-octulosonic-acid transferase
MFVLLESEFWPNMLSECAARNIPIAVVNARISDRSYPRYMRLRGLWRGILSSLTLVLAQSEEDVGRLRAIGVPGNRVFWAGNLKYDIRAPEETAFNIALSSHLNLQTRLVIAGSTLEGEERMLLEAWPKLLAASSDLVLLLAPRHPERFDTVADLLDQSRLKWHRRSVWMASPRPLEPGTILLLDSIGELASAYSLAAVAFVGGSLVPAGGHNPLEPAQFAVPVVIGPHYANFRAIVDELGRHSAIRVATPDTLALTLTDMLNDPSKSSSIGERGKEIFERHAGATERAVSAIVGLLHERRGLDMAPGASPS